MYYRTILCLANSRKPPSGRCVAGKEPSGIRAGQWVRPVSARPGREVSEEERRYENGQRARLLDIIRIPLSAHFPDGHQQENHVLEEGHCWERRGSASWDQVTALVDAFDPLFWIQAEHTYHGMNDKVSANVAQTIPCSLKLLMLEHLFIRVQLEDGYQGRPGRRRVRARFDYEGRRYVLSVTDPEIEEEYLAQQDGEYEITGAVVCISLAEVWEEYDYAFRVVASIITPDRCGIQP